MLDLIGSALDERQLPFQRIDGQLSLPKRKEALEKFGNDPRCNIMLASIGAAGEGYTSPPPDYVPNGGLPLIVTVVLTSLLQLRFILWSLIGTLWPNLKLLTVYIVSVRHTMWRLLGILLMSQLKRYVLPHGLFRNC
jgi:hypothetical protein